MAKKCPARRAGCSDITLNSVCLLLPMIFLTAALIIYVLRNQVKSGGEGSPVFSHPPTKTTDDFIYVDVPSARLVLLASWISTIAPLLTGFVINLATYPIAQRLYEDTATQTRVDNLPTAFQLSLMLKLINGSTWGGLWALLQYSLKWKHRIDRRAAALTSLTAATAAALLLSALVFGADTWLHFATEPFDLDQTAAISTHNVLHSFQPLSSCMMTNNSLAALQETNTSCTVRPPLDQPVFVNPIATMQTVSNQSSSTSVLYDATTKLSYLNPSFDSLDPTIDFVASRYAVRTTCKPVSKACNLTNNGNVTFNCNNGPFQAGGDEMIKVGFAQQVFKTQNMSDTNDPYHFYGIQNPFYIAVATINSTPNNSTLPKDPDLVPTRTGVSGVFSCSVTLFDIQYAYSEGRIYDLSKVQSNTSITNMFASGIVAPLEFGFEETMAALALAAISAQSAQEFAHDLALTLGNSVLSSGAGSVQIVPAHMAQRTSSLLVSRVSKWPFCVLISINIAFIFLGILVTVLAAMTSQEGRQVQYRLTVAGIVANLFDRENARRESTAVEELFGEFHGVDSSVRHGIDRTSKHGFAWRTIGLSPSEVVVHDVPAAQPDEKPQPDEKRSSTSSLSPYGSRHEESLNGSKGSSIRKQTRWSWMY